MTKEEKADYLQFQSTLPRRERRGAGGRDAQCYMISIHAPAEGATCKEQYHSQIRGISIHAPAEGATD